MKRQRWSVGAIVKISLSNNHHSYGQLLEKGSIAVFNLMTDKEHDIDEITTKPILFTVCVYADIVPSGRWVKIGKAPVAVELQQLPLQFIQDQLKAENFEIYNPNTGEIKKATKKECDGLECTAVWAANHLESRIEDHFAGKENVWVERLKIK
jgi:hypothetical protein